MIAFTTETDAESKALDPESIADDLGPLGSIAAVDGQKVEIGRNFGCDLVARIMANPARRQLDRER